MDHLQKFVLEPGPEDCPVKCRITRNCKGIDKGIFPTYFLHYEQDNGRRIFLLAGRKRKKCSTSTYVLSTDPTDLSRQGNSTLASVRSNLLGTMFSVSRAVSNHCDDRFDTGRKKRNIKSLSHSLENLNRPQSGHSGSDHSSHGSHGQSSEKNYSTLGNSCCVGAGPRVVPHVPQMNCSYHSTPVSSNNTINRSRLQDIACVIYQPNILGIAGPRKMKVLLPLPSLSSFHTVMCSGCNSLPCSGGRSLMDKYKDRDVCDMILLHNKEAAWDKKLNSYVLNFRGRANQASVKNFQLCHSHNPEIVIMQLGKVEQDVFIMDFRYPLSALQAFGIALSSFDCKIACE